MSRRSRPSPVPAANEPEPQGRRSYLEGSQEIPGIGPDVRGGYRPQDRRLDDTILLGHPEAAGTYCGGYDNSSRTLEVDPYRMDRNYASPEVIRRRSKSPYGGY